ncbi:MAG: DUF302 domain-containing protein [Chitinivibrionales bacterium]|nr:DUF302 domain-containing protein [Chitinivibrionales bacterium]MBD3357510.1 DUF302 domain-containing protein [Chitinivibrionales bacterium]
MANRIDEIAMDGECAGVRRLILNKTADEILDRYLPDALTREGFVILSQISLDDALHAKLGLDLRHYTIIGVCHPHVSEGIPPSPESLGLFLQCNIVVYEVQSQSIVAVIRPTVALEAVSGEGLREIAEGLEERLERVLDTLALTKPPNSPKRTILASRKPGTKHWP